MPTNRGAPIRGLTAAQAAARLATDGPNVVVAPKPPHVVARVARQLADPLVLLLLAALVVTVWLSDWTDAAVIALVVIVNTAIGVSQEVRADRAIAALDEITAPSARVVRDGVDQVIPAAELVRGDLVRLEAGDVVPADLTLTAAHRLQLDESALTGESVAVARDVGEPALAGTVAVVGRADGVVSKTGAASALGSIAALVATAHSGPTPLQRRLSALSRMLGATVVVLSAVVFGLGVAAGRPVIGMAVTAVSLVVAAVPESLPAVVTLALALGARRMAAQRAIPRRLHAVETLGSVTVVASDKTGTLTEGRMAVQRAWVADGAVPDGASYTVEGTGYAPAGEVRGADGVRVSPPSGLVELARAGLLCSDATIAPIATAPGEDVVEEPVWRAVGDPLEAALVTFAARCGLDLEAERATWVRVDEAPFDQGTRRMTTVHRRPDGRYLVICKGAPEAVLAPPVVPAAPPSALTAAHELATQGLRVLALAAAVVAKRPNVHAPKGLSFLGLVGVGDPVRRGAPDIAREFSDAGIRLVLITGDHPATAAAVGAHLGIWRDGDGMVHGGDGAPDAGRANEVRVFARTQPDQKLHIIAALQQHGHVVAMTGDGVNDAPALRKADIGVAMGGGTEVARQAADLVLVDDNLATVATAVREGRRIYDNIRRFLRYGLSGGVAEILVMLLGPFLGLAVPLLPAQILWVNLLTHGLPGVAMGAEPVEPGVMQRPPRSPQESVLGDGLLRDVLVTGCVLTATVLGVGVLAAHNGRPWQSMVFMVLGLGQLGIALAVRAPRHRGGPGNPGLAAAVALSGLLQVAGVVVGPLRTLLGTHPLTLVDLAWCFAAGTLPALVLLAGRVVATWRRRAP